MNRRTRQGPVQPEVVEAPDSRFLAAGETAPLAKRLPRFLCGARNAEVVLRSGCFGLVGSGSVGLQTLVSLAPLDLAEVVIVDPGNFKAESRLTHPPLLFDLGESKARFAAHWFKSQSPRTRVRFADARFEELSDWALAGVDVVILATDNLQAEVAVGERCLQLGIPILQGSVYGPMLVAQVRAFAGHPAGDEPCPACGFGEEEWRHLAESTRFSCESLPAEPARSSRPAAGAQIKRPPTMSLRSLCALAGDLVAMQLLRWMLDPASPRRSEMIEYCGFNHKTTIVPLAKSQSCPCDHVTLLRVPGFPEGESLTAQSPASLFRWARAGAGLGSAGFLLSIDDASFVEHGDCNGCRERVEIRRFAHPAEALSCRWCFAPLAVHSFFAHRSVSDAILGSLVDAPLRDFGDANVQNLTIRTGDSAFWFSGGSPASLRTSQP